MEHRPGAGARRHRPGDPGQRRRWRPGSPSSSSAGCCCWPGSPVSSRPCWACAREGSRRHAVGSGVLLVLGLMCLRNVEAAAVTLTLVAGALFLLTGLVRVIAAVAGDGHRLGLLVGGGIGIVLGLAVLLNLFTASYALLGVLIGIQTVGEGLTMILVGGLTMATSRPSRSPPAPRPPAPVARCAGWARARCATEGSSSPARWPRLREHPDQDAGAGRRRRGSGRRPERLRGPEGDRSHQDRPVLPPAQAPVAARRAARRRSPRGSPGRRRC